LDGIVPVLRHTPPIMSWRSMMATRRSSLAAAIAAFLPAGAGTYHQDVVVIHSTSLMIKSPVVKTCTRSVNTLAAAAQKDQRTFFS